MIKALARVIAALNGNVKRTHLAAGFAWGTLLGLIPVGNIFWIVLLFISFFFKNNHWTKILFMTVLIILSPMIAPLIDQLGWAVLHIEALRGLFTSWYNMPFVPWTKFYNTLVAGGLVSGIVLWLPVFGLFMVLISLYRTYVAAKIRNSKFIKAIVKFPLFALLDKAMKGL